MTETESPPKAPGPPRRSRTPSRRVAVSISIAVLVVILAVWIVAFSPVLGVKSVAVRGTGFLTPAEVRSAAAVKHGTPLLRLDTGAIERRVQRLPEVKSVSVHTSYPNAVTITVVERRPVGFVESAGNTFVLVDASGTRFRTAHVRPKTLPLFVLPTGDQASSAAAAVASVAGDLTSALLHRVKSIQAFDSTSITLLLTDGRVVRWGSVARSVDKARVLPTLLQQPGTQFDVSDPDQVITR